MLSSGKITLCIPSSILEEIFKKVNTFSRNKSIKSDQGIKEQKNEIMDSIKSSKLVITGVLGKAEATLLDVVNMQAGDLIVLDKDINSDVDICIDNVKWFEGKWGTRKKKNVIKINKIIH